MSWVVVSILQLTDIKWSYWKWLYHMWTITTQNDTQIWHSAFIGAPCKTLFCDYWGRLKSVNITCDCCDGFVTCSGRSGELLYITFIHSVLSTIGLYSEELAPENFSFQWPDRTQTQLTHQKILKEGNGDQKYLRCIDIQDNNFEVMHS